MIRVGDWVAATMTWRRSRGGHQLAHLYGHATNGACGLGAPIGVTRPLDPDELTSNGQPMGRVCERCSSYRRAK
jgi:hypothetical protein